MVGTHTLKCNIYMRCDHCFLCIGPRNMLPSKGPAMSMIDMAPLSLLLMASGSQGEVLKQQCCMPRGRNHGSPPGESSRRGPHSRSLGFKLHNTDTPLSKKRTLNHDNKQKKGSMNNSCH